MSLAVDRKPRIEIEDGWYHVYNRVSIGDRQKAARRSDWKATRVGIDPESPEPISNWHPFRETEHEPLHVNPDATHVDFHGRTTDVERPRLEAGEFLRRICGLAGFDVEQLASRARDRSTADARKVIATLGVERWGQKRTALALVLNKNPDVVSFWAGEGTRRRQEDPDYASMLDALDERLSSSLIGKS